MDNNCQSCSLAHFQLKSSLAPCVWAKALKIVLIVLSCLLVIFSLFSVLILFDVINNFTVFCSVIFSIFYFICFAVANILFYMSKQHVKSKLAVIVHYSSIIAVLITSFVMIYIAFGQIFNFLISDGTIADLKSNFSVQLPSALLTVYSCLALIESTMLIFAYKTNKKLPFALFCNLTCLILQLATFIHSFFAHTNLHLLVTIVCFYILYFVKSNKQIKVYSLILENGCEIGVTKKDAASLKRHLESARKYGDSASLSVQKGA